MSCSAPQPVSTDSPRPLRPRPSRRASRRRVSQTYWAQEQDRVDGAVPTDRRLALLRQFGDFSVAYSTAVQPRLEYCGDERGYLAFRRRWGISYALGDPVADAADHVELLDQFVDQQRRVVFCQISESVARILHDRGFWVNEIGVDTTIELPDYSFAGKRKEWLRYAANWSRRRDYRIVEAGFDEIAPRQVEIVSEAWRSTRTVKRKEVRFLNRPIVMHDEPNVRKFFYLSATGQLLAYVFLDPLYRDGRLVGFVTSIKRRHPDAPIYAEQAIMKQIIETLQAEGHAELKLGLSPLAWIEDADFRRSRLTGLLFRHAFRAGWVNKRFYHLLGHADYKRRFQGVEEKVYMASNAPFSPLRLAGLLGLCGVA